MAAKSLMGLGSFLCFIKTSVTIIINIWLFEMNVKLLYNLYYLEGDLLAKQAIVENRYITIEGYGS